jgi:hypothetical protein
VLLAACAFVGAAVACSSSGTTVDAGTGGSAGTGPVPPATANSAPGSTAGDGYPGWDTCRTRIAYHQIQQDATDPDPAIRSSAVATLHRLPVPQGSEAGWTLFVQEQERTAQLAAQITESDPSAFADALTKLTHTDPAMNQLYKQVVDLGPKANFTDSWTSTPCDPVGMPDGFGCADPVACTGAWIDAQARGDQRALDLLGSMTTPTRPPGRHYTAGACNPYPTGATMCTVTVTAALSPDGKPMEPNGTTVATPGRSVELGTNLLWARTTDGRWYGTGVI